MRLSYLEWGAATPDALCFLCLHGLVATGESFARMAEHLAGDCYIVALDLPGNGASETRAELDLSFAGLATVVQAFAAEIGVLRPIVIGHSHGGALALRAAASDPESIGALVLLCPAHPFSGHEGAIVGFYLSPAGRIFAHLIPRLPKPLQRWGFRQMLGSRSRGDFAWFPPYERNLRRPGVVGHILRLLRSWKADMAILRKDLQARELSLPVLLIWGADDRVVSPGTAGALQARLRQSELVILPGVGHLPNEEDPKECAALIRDWSTRLP